MSDLHSINSDASHSALEVRTLEMAWDGQLPGRTEQSIHVKYDFSRQEKQAGPEGHRVPTHAFAAS